MYLFEVVSDEFANNLMRVTIPNLSARAGWELDDQAILALMTELEISYPVQVRYMTATSGLIGRHRACVDPEPHHGITLNQASPVDEANSFLIHELAHARQSEQFVKQTGKPHNRFYYDAYKQARGPHGSAYWENSFEQEARSFQYVYAPIRKVVVPV